MIPVLFLQGQTTEPFFWYPLLKTPPTLQTPLEAKILRNSKNALRWGVDEIPRYEGVCLLFSLWLVALSFSSKVYVKIATTVKKRMTFSFF